MLLDNGGIRMRSLGMENFKKTKIYALTDEALSKGRSNLEVVDQLIQAGITFLQYREKEKTAKEMYEQCTAIRKMTRDANVTFVIDDFVDLALAVDADGVHIGQDDLPAQIVRKLIGSDKILGLSTHCPEQLRLAEALGYVDYVGVGPVFATQTKKNVSAPVGLAFVKYAATQGKLPFVAIGGIKEHNIAEVCAAGAQTTAVVSAIVGAEDIGAKVKSLQSLMNISC